MTSLLNDADHLSIIDAVAADDLEPTVLANWDATVNRDLGDTAPISTIE